MTFVISHFAGNRMNSQTEQTKARCRQLGWVISQVNSHDSQINDDNLQKKLSDRTFCLLILRISSHG